MERSHLDKIIEGVQEAIKDSHLDELAGDIKRSLTEPGSETATGDIVEHVFTVGERPELTVSNISGHIQVAAGEDHLIRMGATKRGSSRAKENTRIEYSQDGDQVRIQTKADKSSLLNLGRTISSVEYQISVPRNCEVHAHGVSADVLIEGIESSVRAHTVSGDVLFRRLSGDCHVNTVSGDVSGHGLRGSLGLNTTSGDVKISESNLDHFNLNSVSGDFVIQTPLQPGHDYLAKTVSGDLHLHIPTDTGATVQMKSVSGDVVSDLPAEIVKAGKRHWQGRINGGGARVEMNSVSGDLRVSPAPWQASETAVGGGSEAGNVSSPPGATEPVVESGELSDETRTILQALERGDITVEEATNRLEGLL